MLSKKVSCQDNIWCRRNYLHQSRRADDLPLPFPPHPLFLSHAHLPGLFPTFPTALKLRRSCLRLFRRYPSPYTSRRWTECPGLPCAVTTFFSFHTRPSLFVV